MHDPCDNFVEEESSINELEGLKDAIDEAEDVCAEFATDVYGSATGLKRSGTAFKGTRGRLRNSRTEQFEDFRLLLPG